MRITSTALVRPVRSVAWELRAAWARGFRVSLSIEGDERRVEGHVAAVSATEAYAVVGDLHVPLERILGVHRPSRLGDSTHDDRTPWSGRVPRATRTAPGQLPLF